MKTYFPVMYAMIQCMDFSHICLFTEDEPPKTMMATEGGDDNLPPQVSAS